MELVAHYQQLKTRKTLKSIEKKVLHKYKHQIQIRYTVKNGVSIQHAKTDTQTCENDPFACDIHTPACQFLNIFLLRHAQFFRTHARVCSRDFYTRASDFHTRSCDLDQNFNQI
jgi:hypothetical protein